VIRFLEKFSDTDLISFNVAAALKAVRTANPPKSFRAPRFLRSQFVGVTLGPRHRLSDDLTERICAGYWALRFASVPGARTIVAETLNRHAVPTGSRGYSQWSGAEVAERVKQYEQNVLIKQSPDLKGSRKWLVERWTAAFEAFDAPS
jgi:hypothetical protein